MQSLLITICIINSTLLILHEIESAYENEWNLLHLPGKISFFLILHIPILLVLFYCPIGLLLNTKASTILSASIGMAGVLPFLVHKVFASWKILEKLNMKKIGTEKREATGEELLYKYEITRDTYFSNEILS
jgi:hypothetical protein